MVFTCNTYAKNEEGVRGLKGDLRTGRKERKRTKKRGNSHIHKNIYLITCTQHACMPCRKTLLQGHQLKQRRILLHQQYVLKKLWHHRWHCRFFQLYSF